MLITKPIQAIISFSILFLLFSCTSNNKGFETESEENDMYDGPDKAAAFEYNRTKDPATGKCLENVCYKH